MSHDLVQKQASPFWHLGTRALSLADQVVFSLANFILTIIIGKYYTDTDIAAYGIGLSAALVIQGAQRTCYIVQNAILSPGIFRRRASKVLGQHLIVWGIILLIEIIGGIFLIYRHPDQFHVEILVSAIVCSLIYAQLDFDRIMMIKHEKIADPFFASAIFLALNITLFIIIPYIKISFLMVLILIGLFAVMKIRRLIRMVGPPDFFWGWRLAMRDFRRHLPGSLLGTAGYSGYNHIPLFVLGYLALPMHSAVFIVMRGLMQPLQILIRSLDVIDKNLFQLKGVSPQQMSAVILRQVTLYGGLSVLFVILTFLFGPYLLHVIYHDKYNDYSSILTAWAIIMGLLAITFPLETAIVKLNRLTIYNAFRLVAGMIGCVLAVLLCPGLGVWGAVIACLGGWIVSIACALWVVRDIFITAKERTPKVV